MQNRATHRCAIAEHRVTKFFAPPTVWIGLLRHPDFDGADLSSLRKGYYGASPMPVAVLEEIRRRLPDVDLWNFYGQTEMAPLATILGPDEQLAYPGSAGRAALNVETRIVDDRDEPVPAGTVGEIVHRSPHATLGYYHDEDKTVEAFRGGWFHSGDLGYLDDGGRLYVVDRKKDMIKTGGENVASREVEEAIYLLDGVAEVAVFGISHPRWVEAVAAVVVPRPDAALTSDEVIAHTRSVLAGFKTPKYVVVSRRAAEEPERQDPQACPPRGARRPGAGVTPGLRGGEPAPQQGAIGLEQAVQPERYVERRTRDDPRVLPADQTGHERRAQLVDHAGVQQVVQQAAAPPRRATRSSRGRPAPACSSTRSTSLRPGHQHLVGAEHLAGLGQADRVGGRRQQHLAGPAGPQGLRHLPAPADHDRRPVRRPVALDPGCPRAHQDRRRRPSAGGRRRACRRRC